MSKSITDKNGAGQEQEKNSFPIKREDLPPIPENSKNTGRAVDPELTTENLKNLLEIAIRDHDDEGVNSINALLDDRKEEDIYLPAFDPKNRLPLPHIEADIEGDSRRMAQRLADAETENKARAGSRGDTEAEPTPVDLEYQPANLPGNDWIPEYAPLPGITINRAVAIWHGSGGSSKSLFVLSASCALITGRGSICGMNMTGRPKPGGGHEEIRHRVLYFSLEDPLSVIEGRIGALCSLYNIDSGQLAELLIVDRDRAKPLIQSADLYSRIMSIRKLAGEIKPTIIFIDHMRLFSPDAEKSPDAAMQTIKGLEHVAADLNLAIVVLHHDRKMPPMNGQATQGDDMASGTTGLHTNSRAFAQFRATEDGGLLITGGKSNYTKRFGQQEYMIDTETINGHAQPVLAAIQQPDVFDGIPAKTCKEIVKAITEAQPELARENPTQEGWAGAIVAELAEMEIGDIKKSNRTQAESNNRDRIREMLSAWVRAGYLKIEKVDIPNKHRHKRAGRIYRKGAEKYA